MKTRILVLMVLISIFLVSSCTRDFSTSPPQDEKQDKKIVITEPCIISEPGYYIFKYDLLNCGSGIIVEADLDEGDSIVIDGQGYRLSGINSLYFSGVWIKNNNVVIKNLEVANFEQGINLYENVNGCKIYNNKFISNNIGVLVFTNRISTNNEIYSNIFSDGDGGINLLYGDNTKVYSNEMHSRGIMIGFGDNNEIYSNIFNSVEGSAIYIDYGRNNHIHHNSGSAQGAGIYINIFRQGFDRPVNNYGDGNKIVGENVDDYGCNEYGNNVVNNH